MGFHETAVRVPDDDETGAGGHAAYWLLWGDRPFALKQGPTIVGRDADVDIRIDALTVSRRHARIMVVNARAAVEDLGSKNGTWLHGERVSAPRPIVDGDEITFGSEVATFRILSTPSSTGET